MSIRLKATRGEKRGEQRTGRTKEKPLLVALIDMCVSVKWVR